MAYSGSALGTAGPDFHLDSRTETVENHDQPVSHEASEICVANAREIRCGDTGTSMCELGIEEYSSRPQNLRQTPGVRLGVIRASWPGCHPTFSEDRKYPIVIQARAITGSAIRRSVHPEFTREIVKFSSTRAVRWTPLAGIATVYN
jgi:hypothetical protein